MFMHICIFFDDVINPPFKTRRAIFWHKVFSILGHIPIFWGFYWFLAFLDPKQGPMNGKLLREIPGKGLADR